MEYFSSKPKLVALLLNMGYQHYFKFREAILKSDLYCGITNDLERRRKEHNVAQYIHTVKMDSFELAQEVEAIMHDAGFDTGKQLGNGQEDTVYVYLYRKIPGVTIENP